MADNNQDFLDFDFGIVDDNELEQMEETFNSSTVDSSPEEIEEINETPAQQIPLAEEKKEEEETPEATEETETPEEEDDYFVNLSQGLMKAGIFSEMEEDEIPKTEEEFLNHFQEEIQSGAQSMLTSYLNKFGDEKRKQVFETIDAIFTKGVDPDEYFQSLGKIESFKALEIEGEDNVANQEKVIRASLAAEGFDSAVIERKIKKITEYGELEEEAKERLPLLVKKEEKSLQKKIQEQEAAAQRKKAEEDQHNASIFSLLQQGLKEKEVDGIPLNKQKAEDTFNFMTTKKYQLSDGTPLTEFEAWWLNLQKPENHQFRVKLALLAQNNLNLEPVKKTAISKEKESLFRKTKQVHKQQSRTENSSKASSDFLFS